MFCLWILNDILIFYTCIRLIVVIRFVCVCAWGVLFYFIFFIHGFILFFEGGGGHNIHLQFVKCKIRLRNK